VVHELLGNEVPVFVLGLEESGHDGGVVVSLLLELGLFRAVVQFLELVRLLPVGGVNTHPGLESGSVSSTGADVRVKAVDLGEVSVTVTKLGCEVVSGHEQGPAVFEARGEDTSQGVDALDHVLREVLSHEVDSCLHDGHGGGGDFLDQSLGTSFTGLDCGANTFIGNLASGTLKIL